MKKILYLIIPILIIFYFYWILHPILLLKECTVELSQDIHIKTSDFIDSSSKNIDYSKISLQCDFENKVGKYPVTIHYQNITETTILIIQDTTSPKFIKYTDSLTLKPGEDILSNFEASDESKVTLSIQENIDTSMPIDTTIHIKASDPYQNTTIISCHLIIEKKAETKKEEAIEEEYTLQETYTPTTIQDLPIQQTQPAVPDYIEPSTPACSYSGSVGNCGMTFNSYGEAIAYADSFLMNNAWTYSGYSTEKIGCPDIWTVNFY